MLGRQAGIWLGNQYKKGKIERWAKRSMNVVAPRVPLNGVFWMTVAVNKKFKAMAI